MKTQARIMRTEMNWISNIRNLKYGNSQQVCWFYGQKQMPSYLIST